MARIEIEDARTNSAEALALSQNAGRRYAPFVWLGIAAVIVAVAALAFVMTRSATEPLVTRLEVTTPPTFDSSSFAISPDGRQLIFVANAEGRPQLWIRPLDDVTARPISGTSGASAPFWSPDSRRIGFFAEGKLKTINVMSGAAQVLADASSGRGGTWNRDDVIVFAPETNNVGLKRVAATGGTLAAVTKLGPVTAAIVGRNFCRTAGNFSSSAAARMTRASPASMLRLSMAANRGACSLPTRLRCSYRPDICCVCRRASSAPMVSMRLASR